MKIFALISLIAAFTCFFLGNFIYYKNPENRLNKLVAFLSILVGFLAFVEFGYRQAETIDTAIFWLKISSLWTFVPSILLNIFLVYTNKDELLKRKITYLLIYTPAVALAIAGLFLFPINAIEEYWGWTYSFSPIPLFFICMSVWSFIGGFITAFFILKYYFQSKDKLKKNQTGYIFLGLFAPFVFSLSCDLILPIFSIRIPEITMTSITLGLIFITYGIWKYRFPILTPAMAADKIIATMNNFLIILNTENKIVLVNQSSLKLLKYEKDDLVGESYDLIFNKDDQDFLIKILNSGEIGRVKTFETTIKSSVNDLIPVLMSVSLIKISEKEPLGLVCIGSDLTKEKEIKEALEKTEILYSTLVNTDPDAIITADLQGNIIYTSKQALQMYGYENKEELLGKSIFDLITPECQDKARADRDKTLNKTILRNLEYLLVRKNGDQFIGEWNVAVIKDTKENPTAFMITARDITHHKNIEAQMQASIHEKNVLLREIHHRVKNNLQIISSLLNLQSMYVKDENTLEVLRESQNRVKSMAIIHEKLYQSSNFAEINVAEYLNKLIENIYGSYGININLIKIEIHAKDIFLDINKAIPCFLVANEVITNSIKHAFPDGSGKIIIDFKETNENYVMSIKDNGVGLPKDFNTKKTNTLGIQLINGLILQLDGELEVNSTDGTEFKIIFKKDD